jgi:hypothetical protein
MVQLTDPMASKSSVNNEDFHRDQVLLWGVDYTLSGPNQ